MDVTIAELTIPEGKKGTKITVAQMWKLVNANYKDPHLIGTAMDIIKDVPGHDYLGEAEAIFKFVKGYVTYRRDPEGVEFVRDPFVTLLNRVGDCDCQSVLTASLAKAAGFPVRFTTVSTEDPEYWNHVFAEINVAGIWLAADTTEPRSYLGWHPTSQYGEKIWGDPANKIITEGGINMAGYIPTAGESLVLIQVQSLINEVNDWGFFTAAATKRIGRDKLKIISASANTNLTGTKRDFVAATADALWDGFSAWQKSGQTESVYIRNLKKMETVLQTEPNQVTLVVEKIIEVPAPAPAPAPTPTPLMPGTTTPVETKILGMSKGTAVKVGIGTAVVAAIGLWLWKRKKGRK